MLRPPDGETSFGGVETPSSGSRSNTRRIWYSRGGHVCFGVLNTLPSLVLSDGDNESIGTCPLAHPWPDRLLYAFPPFPQIG